jgi:hypothetical protein
MELPEQIKILIIYTLLNKVYCQNDFIKLSKLVKSNYIF